MLKAFVLLICLGVIFWLSPCSTCLQFESLKYPLHQLSDHIETFGRQLEPEGCTHTYTSYTCDVTLCYEVILVLTSVELHFLFGLFQSLNQGVDGYSFVIVFPIMELQTGCAGESLGIWERLFPFVFFYKEKEMNDRSSEHI